MKNASFAQSAGCALLVGALLTAAGCSGGVKGDRDNRGTFKVNRISTGQGQVFPYRIRQVDSFGNPTSTVLNIENIATLKANATGNNKVLPVAVLPTTATLPNGSPGNHFLHFEFSNKLEIDSILSPVLANQTNAGLTTAVSVLAYNPVTEQTTTLDGRGFVNGYTYYNNGGQLELVQAVEANGDNVTIRDARANGFPSYAGAASLVSNKSFVFVADTNNNLTDNELFPANTLIRLVVNNSVRNSEGNILEEEVCTATTVGADPNPPQVLGFSATPSISPGNGDAGVDPTSTILVRFNKPVQPSEVGSFFDAANLTPASGGLTLNVTAAAQTFRIIYHADPLGFGDFCNYIVRPAYNMPGQSQVDVTVQNTTITGLSNNQQLGQAVTTSFTTGVGPGIINAPVCPEAIYVGVGGPEPGISVIDMNGFGQGTGDINNTRWPLNPNIGQPGVNPVLAPGSSNLDAGSAGVLSVVKDTAGNELLIGAPTVGTVGDIHVGAPLDLVFNNVNINREAGAQNQLNPATGALMPGNSITQPPHPNPPRLIFPPPNTSQAIFGEEPTITSSAGIGTVITTTPPCTGSPINLLVQGNPFSTNQGELGIYGTFSVGNFVGPQPPPQSPPPPPPYCPFASRQQVGHFLYVLDRDNRQVVVLNSNRFTVLDTIRLSDPVSMAMAPNLSRLAVTNFASSTVSFIDIDPLSTTFHQVVQETRVEQGPTAIAFQPDGEDVLVLSPGSNFMSILSAQDFTVRRSVAGFLSNPVDVAITERYVATGFAQGVYFAYILNGNGSVAVYESGPDGVNGIGFNDVIGTVPNAVFSRAQSMHLDWQSQNGGVLIGHVDDNGLGQVSRLEMTSSPGVTPLNPNSGGFIQPPTFRQKEWAVTARYGGINSTTPISSLLSGNSVVDFARDEIYNFGAGVGQVTQFSPVNGEPSFGHSGKQALKIVGGAAVKPMLSKLLLIGLSDVGKIDVLELTTGNKIASIDRSGVRILAGYWRQ